MHTLFTMVDFDDIIGLSVVVHNEAQTRIACGTIKEIGMLFAQCVCVCVYVCVCRYSIAITIAATTITITISQ